MVPDCYTKDTAPSSPWIMASPLALSGSTLMLQVPGDFPLLNLPQPLWPRQESGILFIGGSLVTLNYTSSNLACRSPQVKQGRKEHTKYFMQPLTCSMVLNSGWVDVRWTHSWPHWQIIMWTGALACSVGRWATVQAVWWQAAAVLHSPDEVCFLCNCGGATNQLHQMAMIQCIIQHQLTVWAGALHLANTPTAHQPSCHGCCC